MCDSNDADLANFFARPIKILSANWSTSLFFSETFNPWSLFFENPRVSNRISNYYLARAKLKVKFLINGTTFHYGRLMASYLPLAPYDDFTQDRAYILDDRIAASQRPHVFLNPTTSQGGTLTLPFVWSLNNMNVTQSDWSSLGQIHIRELTGLKHANDTGDIVTISVFAWAEDVVLSVPTSVEPNTLSPQMGEVDEYGTGPVSKPAAVVAQAAGALSVLPTIGPYARATQSVASGVSKLAHLLGFSAPTVIDPLTQVTPRYVGNLTNVNIPDSSTKLSLDCKQETTIDSRVVGLDGTDEMTIRSIATRESYLTSFTWPLDAAPEDLLWNTEVSPVLWNEFTQGATELHFPACCFAALPFRYWRGTMKFRFQVVASGFHKGRMKIAYDPVYFASNEYNTNYTRIIDIGTEKDFTVSIGWGRDRSLCGSRTPGLSTMPYGTDPLPTASEIYSNGMLSVFVVNDLVVPNTTVNNDITVNVFVSAGEDFEVFQPSSVKIENYSWFTTDPPPPVLDAQTGELEEDVPIQGNVSESMLSAPAPTDHTVDIYTGDPIMSFRQCLKRYNWFTVYLSGQETTQDYIWSARVPNYPFYRGYAPDGIHRTAASHPYNYCKMTLLNWVIPAYTCVRGGVRWKYITTGGNTNRNETLFAVSRLSDDDSFNGFSTTYEPLETMGATESVRAKQYVRSFPHTWEGAAVTSVNQNPVVEVDIPYYSQFRFLPAKDADRTSSSYENYYHRLWLTQITSSSGNIEPPAVHAFVSISEDFNLAFFTGCPRAFWSPHSTEP